MADNTIIKDRPEDCADHTASIGNNLLPDAVDHIFITAP
jgi:hypothetical protein